MIMQYNTGLEKPNYNQHSTTSSQSNPMKKLYNLPVKSLDIKSENSGHRKTLLASVNSYNRWVSFVESDQFKVLPVWIDDIRFRVKQSEIETDVKKQFVSIVHYICERDKVGFLPPEPERIQSLLKSSRIETEIRNLFAMAKHIDIEPGFSNAFSEGLEQAIAEYGEPALHEITKVILSERTKSSIAMEALQYVGHAESRTFLDARRNMLERCLLQSRSAWVRDGAGLGIASLNDCRSIDALEKAIENETSEALKEDLTLVLDQLQAASPD